VRAVVQRVARASVTVGEEVVGSVERGLCVFVGVAVEDGDADAEVLATKVVRLRIFEDAAGKMNHDVLEAAGKVLAVSQFTLLGDTRGGRRPSFGSAMPPERASELFDVFCAHCRTLGAAVATGRFRTHMQVSIENDGPVTLLIDTKKAF
jgi:D-tyrosyl-tRNA(Tyr) deacylase